MKTKETQSEFIKKYCENSEITERELNDLGQFSVICDCDEENCNGWTMIGRNNIKDHVKLYIK